MKPAVMRALIREIVREEAIPIIENYLNPTFVHMMREGSEQMNHLFDAVIACDEKHDSLLERIVFLEKIVFARWPTSESGPSSP